MVKLNTERFDAVVDQSVSEEAELEIGEDGRDDATRSLDLAVRSPENSDVSPDASSLNAQFASLSVPIANIPNPLGTSIFWGGWDTSDPCDWLDMAPGAFGDTFTPANIGVSLGLNTIFAGQGTAIRAAYGNLTGPLRVAAGSDATGAVVGGTTAAGSGVFGFAGAVVGGLVGAALAVALAPAAGAGLAIGALAFAGGVALSTAGGLLGQAIGTAFDRQRDCREPDPDDDNPLENPLISPLVIDLGGNGIQTLSLENSPVFFDYDGDGIAQRTGWLASGDSVTPGARIDRLYTNDLTREQSGDDYFLVWDQDLDGQISDSTELFGSATQDGFTDLSQHDDNGDGVIDAQDAIWGELQLWQDWRDQPGITEDGELFSLDEMGILSINLSAESVDETNNGNAVTHRSTILVAGDNGPVERTIEDIWFATSTAEVRSALNSSVTIRESVSFLPYLSGAGRMADLHVRMTLEPDFEIMVRDLFLDAPDLSADGFRDRVESILYAWAGVDEVDPDSRGGNVDARQLEFLEIYRNYNFLQLAGTNAGTVNPGPNTGYELGLYFDGILDLYTSTFASHLSHTTNMLIAEALLYGREEEATDIAVSYYESHLLNIGLMFANPYVDGVMSAGEPMLRLAVSNLPDDFAEAIEHINNVLPYFRGLERTYFVNDAEGFEAFVRSGLSGIEDDALFEIAVRRTLRSDMFNGTDGDDQLVANEPEPDRLVRNPDPEVSVLYAGRGDDIMRGGAGEDLYIVLPGDGDDIIVDDANDGAGGINGFSDDVYRTAVDTVAFVGRRAADAIYTIDGDDLIVTFAGDADSRLTITNFLQSRFGIEQLIFSDGLISRFGVLLETGVITFSGSNGAGEGGLTDFGTFGDDAFSAADGAITLVGLSGNDTYNYSRDDASIVIVEDDFGGQDTLNFSDLDLDEVSFGFGTRATRDVVDLVITVIATGETITITNAVQRSSFQRPIDTFTFADGQSLTLNAVITAAIEDQSTSGNDLIGGTERDDVMTPSAGHDVLMGHSGADTYVLQEGSGIDLVVDQYRFVFGDTTPADNILDLSQVDLADVFVSYLGDPLDLFSRGVMIGLRGTGDAIIVDEIRSTFSDILLPDGSLVSASAFLSTLPTNDLSTGSDDILLPSSDRTLFMDHGYDTLAPRQSSGSFSIDVEGLSLEDLDVSIYAVSSLNVQSSVFYLSSNPGAVRIDTPGSGNALLSTLPISSLVFDDGTSVDVEALNAAQLVTGLTDGDDRITLYGDSDDTIAMGRGDDYFEGGRGADTYVFSRGDGQDMIVDPGGTRSTNGRITSLTNYLVIEGYQESEVTVRRLTDGSSSLVFEFEGTDDQIIWRYGARDRSLSDVTFDDGTVWDLDRVLEIADAAADRNILGTSSSETLEATSGSAIFGGGGSDTYVVGSGQGLVTIRDTAGSTDMIVFEDTNLEDAVFRRAQDIQPAGSTTAVGDIIIDQGNGTDMVLLLGNGSRAELGIETFEFADGASLTLDEVKARVLASVVTDGNDRVVGFDGNDTLTGGAGDDVLMGGAGQDTYVFGRGDGHDIVLDALDYARTGDGSIIDMTAFAFSEVEIVYSAAYAESFIVRSLDGTASLLVQGGLNDEEGVASLAFADRTLTRLEVAQIVVDGRMTDGDDTIWVSGDLEVDAGAGNDLFVTNSGTAVYNYQRGDGTDMFAASAVGTSPRNYIVNLTDISREDVSVRDTGQSLYLIINGTNDVVGIDGSGSVSFLGGETLSFSQLRGTLDGIEGTGTEADPYIGTAGDDVVYVSADTGRGRRIYLEAGTGDDEVAVSASFGLHVTFEAGDGNDRYSNLTADGSARFADILYLADYDEEDVLFTRADNSASGEDLIIRFRNSDDTITVAGQLAGPSTGNDRFYENRFEFIELSDGTTIESDDLFQRVVDSSLTSGDDVTVGFDARDDIIGASYGNDLLVGGLGSDAYLMTADSGNDEILELFDFRATDSLVLRDIELADLSFERSGDDLVLTLDDVTSVRLIGQFAGGGVEFVQVGASSIPIGALIAQQFGLAGTVSASTQPSSRADVLAVTASSPGIDGGQGNDSYVVQSNAPQLLIADTGDSTGDVLGVYTSTVSDMNFVRSGDDLNIQTATGSTVTVVDQFANETSGIEAIVGSASGLLTVADVYSRTTTVGTDGNDVLTGLSSRMPGSAARIYNGDTYDAGRGDDSIRDVNGSDSYIFASGDGNDRIEDISSQIQGYDPGLDYDTLRVSGYDVSDMQVSASWSGDEGPSLLLSFGGAASNAQVLRNDGGVVRMDVRDSILLVGQLADGESGIEQISFASGSTMSRFELAAIAVTSGTSGADTLEGGNTLYSATFDAGAGDDVISGFGSNDTAIIASGDGSDTLSGVETVRFVDAVRADVEVFREEQDLLIVQNGQTTRLVNGMDVAATLTVQLGDGTILSGEALRANARLTGGTEGDDSFVGTSRDDIIDGLAGDDIIDGLAGDDLIMGGDGADLLSGGTGSDRLSGGRGDDTLDGGEGIDTVDYSGSGSAVTANLLAGAVNSATEGADTLIGVENIVGSLHDDSLQGDIGANRLDGGRGDDVLSGGAGDDVLIGGLGQDTLMGGAGTDTADYSTSRRAIDVTAVGEGVDRAIASASDGDTLEGVENVIGTNFADNIEGGAGDNFIAGGRGEDRLDGGDGSDTLVGGEGFDRLAGGAGEDVLEGGLGRDLLDGGAGDDTYVWTRGDGSDLILSGAGSDTLRLSGLQSDAFTVIRQGNDVILRFDTGESVTLQDFVSSDNAFTIEHEGGTIGRQDILSRAQTLRAVDLSATDDNFLTANTADTTVFSSEVLLGNDVGLYETGSLVSVSAIDGGTVSLGADGNVVFVANALPGETASFRYVIAREDGQQSSAVATINITDPRNADPVASFGTTTVVEGETFVISVEDFLQSVDDADGDRITIVEILPGEGAQLVQQDGNLVFTPDEGFTGFVRFAVTVTDGRGGFSQDAVGFTVVDANAAPIADNLQLGVLQDGVPFSISLAALLAEVSDPDGDVVENLGLSLIAGEAEIEILDGIVSITGLSANDDGQIVIGITLSDGELDTVRLVTFDYLDVNDAPVALDDGPIVIDVNGDGVIAADLLLSNDSDPDRGDAIGIRSVISQTTGLFVYLDANGDVVIDLERSSFTGEGTFDYILEDPDGLTDRARVTVAVEGRRLIEGTPDSETITGTSFDDEISGLDGDDVIFGGAGDDILRGGSGDDRLDGGTGRDSYVYASGDGNDVIDTARPADFGPVILPGGPLVGVVDGGLGDTLELTDFNASDVRATRDGADLLLLVLSTGETIRVVGQFPDDGDGSDASPFAQGIAEGSGRIVVAAGVSTTEISSDFAIVPTSDVLDSDRFPHVSIEGVGSGAVQTFALDVQEVGATIRIDVDGASFDTILEVFDANGNSVARNDDSSTGVGGTGSNSSLESYLEFQTTAPGPFRIELTDFSSTVVEDGATFVVNVTVIPAGADIGIGPSVIRGIDELSFSDGNTLDRDGIAGLVDESGNTPPTVLDVDLGSVLEDTVFLIDTGALLATANDADGDALSITSISVDPAFGEIALVDGDYTFTPALDVADVDVSLVFEVSDGTSSSTATAQLRIDPVNDAPTLVSSLTPVVTDEDTAVAISVAEILATVVDVDSALSLVDVTASQGEIVDAGNGTLSLIPPQDFNGEITVTYTVSDGEYSVQGTVAVNVGAINDAPNVGVADLGMTDEDVTFTFTAADLLANSVDVDGDDLSVVSVSVDPAFGSVSDNADGSYSFTPSADFNGVGIEIGFEVSDGELSVAGTAVFDIAPVNDAPNVLPVDLGRTDEDMAFTFDAEALLSAASDVDGDDLAIVVASVDPAMGRLVDNGAGVYTFTPAANVNADDVEIAFTVTDGAFQTDGVATLDILAVNDAPEAGVFMAGTIEEDGTLVISESALIATSMDADGDALRVTSITTSPDVGTLIDNGDGTWLFTPTRDLNGTGLTLDFSVSDGELTDSGRILLDISPVNDAPAIGGPVDLGETAEDEILILTTADLLALASDVDGDVLSIVDLVSDSGAIAEIGDGTFEFSPDADFNGEVTLSYGVSDGTTVTAQAATLVVTPVNDAPIVAGSVALGSVSEDTSIIIDTGALLSLASDLDGDALSVVSVSVDSEVGVIDSDGMGGFRYTPAANFNGRDVALAFVVTDGTAEVNGTALIDVIAVNDAPVAVDDSGYSVDAGESLSISIAEILSNDTDADGDTLSLTAVEAGAGGTVVIADGNVVFTSDGTAGPAAFSYTVSDGEGGFASANVLLEVEETDVAGPILGTRGRDRLVGTDGDDTISGLGGRDVLLGGNGDDVLVGGFGSDRLVGGEGNDLMVGDGANGQRGFRDRDAFLLGDATSSGNDVITDFDINGFFGGERSFDALDFSFAGYRWRLDSAYDMFRFTQFIENDGDFDTDALRDGNDLIFVFDRDSDGVITDSVRLQDVIGQNGLSDSLLDFASIDDITESDVFAGDTANDTVARTDHSEFMDAFVDEWTDILI